MSESGKTYNEARGEVARAVDTLRWNGEEASRLSGTAFPGVVKGSRRVSLPEPVGVVVAITAWNFPVLLIARKVGAALAAGCTVIVKASEHCPRSAAILVECLQSAGLPHGAVNLLFGEPERLSQLLINSPHTKALTFTGSTAVGKSLAMMASSRLLRCVMELGGHAPVIVTDESAIDELIALTAPAKFESAGQSCMAPTRYIARRDIYDEVVRRLSEYAAGLKVGHGSDPGVQMGALIHAGRVSALTALVDDAVSRGAKVAHGGGKISGPGAYFEATVLYDVPRDAQIMHEEPFGPIACVVPFDSIEEAVEIANETAYGLAAYVFTDSITDRDYAIDRLEFSNVAVNQTAPSLPDVPIGGVKDSGYGYEGGTIGVHSFMHFRLVSVSSLRGTPGGSND